MTETTETVDATAEGANETADESTADQAATAEDNSKESGAAEEGAAEDEEAQEDDDAEPPTRKPRTNADWVALRRQQKLKKQEAGKREQGEDEDAAEDSDEEDEDDVNDEDAKLIDKRIEKHLAPLKQKEALQELKSEIDTFVSENPDFKPFAAKALKWAQHPSWKDVPTKQLMYAAAGDKLMAIGAKRQKAVIANTQKTKTGANTGGNTGGAKPVAEMTDAEFEQEIQRVKSQPKNA